MTGSRLAAGTIAVLFVLAAGAAPAQVAPGGTEIPWRPIHGVPLDASLPRLVAEGWQIIGVSLRERTFAYHLVRDGMLALCLSDVGAMPPGTECMRLADGPAPAPPGDDGRPRP